MKQLEINTCFETLDFNNINRGACRQADDYHFRVCKQSNRLSFNQHLSKLILERKCTYMQVQRDPINDIIYFIFTTSPTTLRVNTKSSNCKTLGISCKALYDMICKRFSINPQDGGLIPVTKNKSRDNAYIVIQLDPQPEQ